MRSIIARLLVITVAFTAIIMQCVSPVSAATSNTGSSGNGLRISPVVTNVTINPGESSTVKIYVQNVTSTTATFQGIVNDFTADNDESGKPALLLDPNQYAPSHSLKRYISPISPITLNPGEQEPVSIVINVPADAAGGGYFGAIRFVPGDNPNAKNINLLASVASLILVKVPGNITDDLRLASFDVRSDINAGPQLFFTTNKGLMAVARFENKGNIQEQPFGKVALMQGNTQLASYEINPTSPRGNVLPNSIRRFTVSLDKVGAFGRYTVEGNFGYASNGQLLSGKATFYVIPVQMLVALGVVILVVVAAIIALPKLIRNYNRSVIQRASRRR